MWGRLRRHSWSLLCPAKQFFHFRFSRVNLYIAKRNQFAGEYHWSLRRCFRHCPRIHSPRQRHTADKRGGHGNEGAERCNTRALSLSIGGPCVVGRFATTQGLDTWPARCVVRAHDCVRLKEPNDLNGSARPSEHCSKQSSPSPMPPLSSRFAERWTRKPRWMESCIGCFGCLWENRAHHENIARIRRSLLDVRPADDREQRMPALSGADSV